MVIGNCIFEIFFSRDCKTLLPNVAEQVIQDIKREQKKYQFALLSEAAEDALKQQILDISKSDHRIKCLISEFYIILAELMNLLLSNSSS